MSPYAILRFRVDEGHSVWLTDYFSEKEARAAARLLEQGYPGFGFQVVVQHDLPFVAGIPWRQVCYYRRQEVTLLPLITAAKQAANIQEYWRLLRLREWNQGDQAAALARYQQQLEDLRAEWEAFQWTGEALLTAIRKPDYDAWVTEELGLSGWARTERVLEDLAALGRKGKVPAQVEHLAEAIRLSRQAMPLNLAGTWLDRLDVQGVADLVAEVLAVKLPADQIPQWLQELPLHVELDGTVARASEPLCRCRACLRPQGSGCACKPLLCGCGCCDLHCRCDK